MKKRSEQERQSLLRLRMHACMHALMHAITSMQRTWTWSSNKRITLFRDTSYHRPPTPALYCSIGLCADTWKMRAGERKDCEEKGNTPAAKKLPAAQTQLVYMSGEMMPAGHCTCEKLSIKTVGHGELEGCSLLWLLPLASMQAWHPLYVHISRHRALHASGTHESLDLAVIVSYLWHAWLCRATARHLVSILGPSSRG